MQIDLSCSFSVVFNYDGEIWFPQNKKEHMLSPTHVIEDHGEKHNKSHFSYFTEETSIKIIKSKQISLSCSLSVVFNYDQSFVDSLLFIISLTITIFSDREKTRRLTLRCLPLKTTANAPWPIRSFVLYS